MSAQWSTVLRNIGRAVAAGAPVVVHGFAEDAVIADGQVVSLRAGLRRTLERSGVTTIAWIDATAPLAGIAGDHDARLRRLVADPARADWTTAAHTVLCAQDESTAVVLKDPNLLLGDAPPGPQVAQLVDAATSARVAQDARTRNALVVVCRTSDDVPPQLLSLAGMVVVAAPLPSEQERHAALQQLARGFHGARALESDERDRRIRALATQSAGLTLTELSQLRCISAEAELGLDRPQALLRALRPLTGDPWGERPLLALDAVRATLAAEVAGQPAAIDGVARTLVEARDPDPVRPVTAVGGRPKGVCLLTGPSGVGKTETARTIARLLFGSESHLVRIDCGALKNAHDVAKLTGAPPGYVGYAQGGMLTTPVRRNPGSVVLFDEVDKCAEEVLDVLLAVLEEGELRDGDGSVTSFSDAFIILTSNFGQKALLEAVAAGELSTSEDVIAAGRADAERALNDKNPALLSRIQGTVHGFDILRRSALPALVDKAVERLVTNLATDYNLTVEADRAGILADLEAALPTDGAWDGRTADLELRRIARRARHELLDGNDGGRLRPVEPCHTPDGARGLSVR